MMLSRTKTLTIAECCEAFRANDIPMSATKLTALLKTGHYAWGLAVDGKETAALIFKSSFYAWLEEQTGGPVRRLYEDGD